MKYISEYIPNLQIHQHSLLTRKVYSRHILSLQVFFSISYGSSSSHLHIQVIFIFKYGSLLDMLITGSTSSLDHHWVIIIGYGSSLDHHYWIITGSSSLDPDHHYWIITGSSSLVLSLNSSHHRKFYRDSPFS